MIINYLKLKYKIYANRMKRKPKEEVLGEYFGYVIICAFFSFVLYLVFKKIFGGVADRILPIVFLNFIFLVIISLAENFKYIYKSFFEASDKDILFSLPCKNIDIILIKYVGTLINFWKIFLFFYLPCLIAFLFINYEFYLSFIFLMISLNLVGICVISLLYVILISAIYISGGKNIKVTSFLISACITVAVFITIIFFSDSININIVNKGGAAYILLLPLKITSNLMFNFQEGILMCLKNTSILILYTSVVFVLTAKIISAAINNGYLLIDLRTVSKLPVIKIIIESKFIKKVKLILLYKGISKQSFAIAKKDILSLFSNLDLVKLLLPPLFFFIIFDLKIQLSSNGMDLIIGMMIKSLWLTVSLCYFIMENERENFYIILNSGISNIDIIKSKVMTVSFTLVPIILTFDIFVTILHHTSFINFIYFITTDLLIMFFICIIAISAIFKYASVSMTSISIEFNGGLIIFLNIILYIIPVVTMNYINLKLLLNKDIFDLYPMFEALIKLLIILSFLLAEVVFFKFPVKKALEKSELIFHEIN